MNLEDRLVAAANGDVEWRRKLLLEAVEAIKTPAVEWLEQAGPIAAELNERVRDD